MTEFVNKTKIYCSRFYYKLLIERDIYQKIVSKYYTRIYIYIFYYYYYFKK